LNFPLRQSLRALSESHRRKWLTTYPMKIATAKKSSRHHRWVHRWPTSRSAS